MSQFPPLRDVEESPIIKHDAAGLITFKPDPKTGGTGSIFHVTLCPMQELDGEFVVVGKLTEESLQSMLKMADTWDSQKGAFRDEVIIMPVAIRPLAEFEFENPSSDNTAPAKASDKSKAKKGLFSSLFGRKKKA